MMSLSLNPIASKESRTTVNSHFPVLEGFNESLRAVFISYLRVYFKL
jgi:hypothetical protein